jgi:hypothetical protein
MAYKIDMKPVEIEEGYDNHYNHLPSNDVVEISPEAFANILNKHIWDYKDSKQITEWNTNRNATLFIKEAFGLTVGLILRPIHYNHPKYYLFGDWELFSGMFASQFQGDNS